MSPLQLTVCNLILIWGLRLVKQLVDAMTELDSSGCSKQIHY